MTKATEGLSFYYLLPVLHIQPQATTWRQSAGLPMVAVRMPEADLPMSAVAPVHDQGTRVLQAEMAAVHLIAVQAKASSCSRRLSGYSWHGLVVVGDRRPRHGV